MDIANGPSFSHPPWPPSRPSVCWVIVLHFIIMQKQGNVIRVLLLVLLRAGAVHNTDWCTIHTDWYGVWGPISELFVARTMKLVLINIW